MAQDNPGAALELDEEFRAKAEQVCQRLTPYKPGRVKGTREIVVRPNYVMVYCVEEDGGTLAVLRACFMLPGSGRKNIG
ncbi:type II toxin-antitoxin system RelE/ParE family toxin [Propionivibrio sp.]|uniref:type II toxin-antitoxin system RelE/ParE family toxin n=1 Tax=Propionivibrio sp. TaxID=2212460 RepID=UPI003429DC23|nr:type II toxin-antitoxin system RelE/ParE family toxin [Propionivibrio sp.]